MDGAASSPDAPLDLDAYVWRIGYVGDLAPTVETLTRLHRAHTLAIPFENLDILLGKPIPLDLASLQDKLVGRRRGGYCFEQNTLFAAVLEAVGFGVTRLAARVRLGRDPPTPRTHMVLAVEVEGERWLADVGFGGDGLLDPLRFGFGGPVRQGEWTYELEREGASHVVRSLHSNGWVDLYEFTQEPQLPIDYEVANHFTSTWPRSPFVTGIRVQRPGPEERLVLSDDALIVQRPEGEQRVEVTSDRELLEILAERFGLAFPEGTRFRNSAPTWSR